MACSTNDSQTQIRCAGYAGRAEQRPSGPDNSACLHAGLEQSCRYSTHEKNEMLRRAEISLAHVSSMTSTM